MPIGLITGGSGFLGRHLLARIAEANAPGFRWIAIGRRCPPSWPRADYREVDLEDPAMVLGIIREWSPSLVFHLAGKTPPASPADFHRQNATISIQLLRSLTEWDRPCRVILIGSAAELGPVPIEQLPVGEDYPCRPVEPYGSSKLEATRAGLAAGPPLEVIVARVFNLIGPGMSTSQALGRFAAELADGTGPIRLVVGDLEPRRDFIDARDVANALIALGHRGRPGRVYHVGTGRSRRVGDGLDRLIAISGREVTIEVDPDWIRSNGPSDSRADVRRIFKETGWSAQISWEQSLRDLWDEAKARSTAGLTDPHPPV